MQFWAVENPYVWQKWQRRNRLSMVKNQGKIAARGSRKI